MKAKVTRDADFNALMEYLFGKDKTKKNEAGKIIGGNMTGLTTLDLTTEFESVASLRPEINKVCLHFSLRMPRGQDVDDLTWNKIAVRFMEKMKLSPDRPWLLVKHPDEHVHLVTCRVDLDGNLWLGKFEAFQAIKATHELELEFGLELTPTLTTGDIFKTRLTDLEIRMKTDQNEPQLLPKEKLAAIIANAIELSVGSFKCFTWYLQQNNVSLTLNRAKNTDHISGISFLYDGIPYKGSKVARAYSYQGILDQIQKKKPKSIPGQIRPAFFGSTAIFTNVPDPASAPVAGENVPVLPSVTPASSPEMPAAIPKITTLPAIPIITVITATTPPPSIPLQKSTDDHLKVVVAKPVGVTIKPSEVSIPAVVPPVPTPTIVPTLKRIDSGLWKVNLDSWPVGKKILIEQFHFDEKVVAELFIKGRLWFTDDGKLATARYALPSRNIVGITLLPLVPEIQTPIIHGADQQGLFTTGDVFSDYQRVVVVANAIEAIAYQQLSDSGCEDAPPGLVVSADGDFPPLWLVNFVKKSGKKLLLATKTKELTADKVPGSVVNFEFADWFELDVSSSTSWHDLMIDRLKRVENLQAKDVFEK